MTEPNTQSSRPTFTLVDDYGNVIGTREALASKHGWCVSIGGRRVATVAFTPVAPPSSRPDNRTARELVETLRPWIAGALGRQHLDALLAEVERLEGERDVLVTKWNGETMRREAAEALAERRAAALREISKGAGRYAHDPWEHANNTIEDMKALAVAALADGGPENPA